MSKRAIIQDPSAFLGFQCPPAHARAMVLPVPFEETTTYKKGTRQGPEAILEASQQVELFDEELGLEPYLKGIHTLDEFSPVASDLAESIAQIENHARTFLSKKRILAVLGGEHSITIGLVRAHRKLYPHLSVLQIDAHADLRTSYEGSPYNHACVMNQIVKICPAVQVGIRSMSVEESRTAARRKSRIFYARDIVGRSGWHREALSFLTKQVYLTFDLDGLDPSIMPSVGTPEPGGMGWYETLEFLKFVAENREIVGLDIVELCPQENNSAPDFLAARLVYKILGYIFASR